MRTSKTFSVQLWADQKKAINGEALIYARITVDQKRLNISLKRKVAIGSWDARNKKILGSSQTAKEFNRYLDLTKSRLYQCYQELSHEGVVITSKSIKQRFLNEDASNHTLLELMGYHTKKIEKTLAAGTVRNFGVTENYINRFLKNKKLKDIYLQQLNYQFLSDFENFLNSHYPDGHPKAMSHNTVMKHIQRLRKMVTLAYNLEWINSDPFRRWKMSFEKVNREYLSRRELEKLSTYHLPIDRLDRVRDLFVFSCFTGMSFIDIKNLTKGNVWMGGEEGKKWISTFRQKTKSKVKFPLLKRADKILDKYDCHPVTEVSGTLLPTITNEKANLYLKQIADACGIEKNLTFHMARHTFATTIALNNGMPMESVSKILGHSKITTTQIYARITDQKMEADMAALQERLHANPRVNDEESTRIAIQDKSADPEKRDFSHLTKEQLIQKLNEFLTNRA